MNNSCCFITDHVSAILTGLPRQPLDRLHSVMNAAARLDFFVRMYENVTTLLRDLRSWRSPQRIEYRPAVLAFRCQHEMAPSSYNVHCTSTLYDDGNIL